MSRSPSRVTTRVTIDGDAGMPAQQGLVRRAGNGMSDPLAEGLTVASGAGIEHAGTVDIDPTVPGRQDAPSEPTAPRGLGESPVRETRREPHAARMAARRNVGMALRAASDEASPRGSITPDGA